MRRYPTLWVHPQIDRSRASTSVRLQSDRFARVHEGVPAIRPICARPRGCACNPIDLCMSMRPVCNSMKKCMDFAVHQLIELRSRCLSFIKHQLGALLNFLPSECFCSFFNRMVSGATRCSNEPRMVLFLQFALQMNGELQASVALAWCGGVAAERRVVHPRRRSSAALRGPRACRLPQGSSEPSQRKTGLPPALRRKARVTVGGAG